jgi:hypothetical protein
MLYLGGTNPDGMIAGRTRYGKVPGTVIGKDRVSLHRNIDDLDAVVHDDGNALHGWYQYRRGRRLAPSPGQVIFRVGPAVC